MNHFRNLRSRAALRNTRLRQNGFTLIESLVAILLLSVGALGVAGLQVVSLRNSQTADARGRVATLANQMTSEIAIRAAAVQSNPPSLVGGLANFPCTSTPATPLERWRWQLDCEIPGSQGAVAYDPSANRLIVTVQWDDSRGAGGGSATQQFLLDTRI